MSIYNFINSENLINYTRSVLNYCTSSGNPFNYYSTVETQLNIVKSLLKYYFSSESLFDYGTSSGNLFITVLIVETQLSIVEALLDT